jgi:hypothetical protein
MTVEAERMQVWRDDPAEADLLGFGIVAEAVVDLVLDERLDPVTVGVFSRWGGGKSTILALVEGALANRPDAHETCVIRVSPWQYDDFTDVRERLVGEILSGLPQDGEGAKEKMFGLVKRVRWSQIARTVGLAAAAGAVDVKALIESFSLKDKEAPPPLPDMDGFRKEFAGFIANEKQIKRVVVLVDDLDRCLPNAAVAVMEALKLFLSVPKMSFVVAVDHHLIKDSVAASIQAGNREGFADRYLEKIIQVPISLPLLSQQDAITYVALLMLERSLDKADFARVTADVATRRADSFAHALDPEDTAVSRSGVLPLARQIVTGLEAERSSSPRAIKRFLNAWAVRSRLASARGVTLDPTVSLKLLLLEEQYPDDFQVLLSTAPEERPALIRQWEEWAREVPVDVKQDKATKGKVELTPRPDGINDRSKGWARAEPSIPDDAGVTRYLTLASTFFGTSASSSLSDEEIDVLQKLVNATESVRRAGISLLDKMEPSGVARVGRALIERIPLEPQPSNVIESTLALVLKAPELSASAATAIEASKTRLTPGDAVRLSAADTSALVDLAARLQDDPGVPAAVREAFAEEATSRSR